MKKPTEAPPAVSGPAVDRYLGVAVACAAVLGVWARFHALGASSLAVDEYYLLTSARNVLAHGLPQFDCGGYYTRGLLHQYLSAGLLYAGMAPETAIRLPAAAGSCIAVFGAWLLARHVAGKRVAAFVVMLLLLSLWEVEFARFGRMYALFQACAIFYILAAVKYLESGDPRQLRWMVALGLGAIFVYEGGALLAAFTLLAMILRPARLSAVEIAVVAVGLLAAMAAATTDFRTLGSQVSAEFAAHAVHRQSSLFGLELPLLPPLLLLSIGAPIAVGATLAMRAGFENPQPGLPNTHARWLAFSAWLAIAIAMIGGLFLLAGVLLAAAILFEVIDARRLLNRRALIALAVASVLLITVWAAYSLLAPESTFLGFLRRSLRYPDFYLKIGKPWQYVLPYVGTGILATAACAGLLVCISPQDAWDKRYRLLLGITLALVTAVALSHQPYNQTRYTFFIYPILLILLVQGIVLIWRQFAPRATLAVPCLAAALLFVFSCDFSLKHLLHVADTEYLYRTVYDERLATHFYPRWDYRGIAEALSARAAPDDLVITTAYPAMPYALGLIDAVYVERTDPRLQLINACHGTRDLWSNLPLLTDPVQLERIVGQSKRPVWLVLRSERYRTRRPIEAQLEARYGSNEVYRSIDGYLELLRVAPGAAP